MTADAVIRAADEHELRLIRFLYCGNDGTTRGKASSRHGLEGRIASGIGLTVAMQAMNGLDQLQPVPDMGPVGEVRLRPDPATFRVLPYAPRTGAMLVDMIGLDGNPAPVCQRSFLTRMCDRLAERGVRLEVSFENEFSLARAVDGGYEPVDSSLCFSTRSERSGPGAVFVSICSSRPPASARACRPRRTHGPPPPSQHRQPVASTRPRSSSSSRGVAATHVAAPPPPGGASSLRIA